MANGVTRWSCLFSLAWCGSLLLSFPTIWSFAPQRVSSSARSFRYQSPNPHRSTATRPTDIHTRTTETLKSFSLHAKKKGRVRFGSGQSLENLPGKIQRKIDTDTKSVLLVDSNNVRGVDNFKFTNGDLIRSLASWRRSMGMSPSSIVCVIDHGAKPNSFSYDGITLVFAGPNRTADDVIANDCQWFVNGDDNEKCDVLVVTNDRELRVRCKRANNRHDQPSKYRAPSSDDPVQVFSSMHLVKLLKRNWDEQTEAKSEVSIAEATCKDTVLHDLSKVESDVRSYERPVFNPKNRKQKRAHGRKSIHLELQETYEVNTLANEEEDSTIGHSIIGPLGCKDFHERTWHRVLITERLREILEKNKSSEEEETMEILLRYRNMHNSFIGDPVSMLYDQRIRDDQYAKQSLLRYIEQPETSKEHTVESKTTERNLVTGNALVDNIVEFEVHRKKEIFKSSLHETRASFMRSIVEEGNKTQFEIITEYAKTAPGRFQLKKSKEVRALLKKVAIKEKRSPDYFLRWYLIQEGDSN